MQRRADFLQNSIVFFTLALVLLPAFVLAKNFDLSFHFDREEFQWALQNTFNQALGSAFVSVSGGFVLALGLLHWYPHRFLGRFVGQGLLVFNFLPALFVVVFALDFIDPFPVGTVGIILVHALINMGLAAILWAAQLSEQFSGPLQLAYIEGAGRLLVIRAIKRPLVKIFFQLLLLIFVICFSSFTIPLVVGGGRGTTLEVLIYEKIRISGDFSVALTLALIQSAIVVALSYVFLPKNTAPGRSFLFPTRGHYFQKHSLPILSSRTLGYGLLLVVVGLYFRLAQGMLKGFEQVASIEGLGLEVLRLVPATLASGVLVASVSLVLLALQAYVMAGDRAQHFLARLTTLSPALVGFSFLLLGFESSLLAITFALVCLYFPTLFRFLVYEQLKALSGQEEIAYLLGASNLAIFWKIKLPQLMPWLTGVSAMAGLWAMGDFAIGKILFSQNMTLGMLAQTLLGSYRIDAAFAVIGLILFLGVILFGIFRGLTYVYSQRIEEELR